MLLLNLSLVRMENLQWKVYTAGNFMNDFMKFKSYVKDICVYEMY